MRYKLVGLEGRSDLLRPNRGDLREYIWNIKAFIDFNRMALAMSEWEARKAMNVIGSATLTGRTIHQSVSPSVKRVQRIMGISAE
jgi:hypothetical protein